MVPEVVDADWVRRRQFTVHSLEVMSPRRTGKRALGCEPRPAVIVSARAGGLEAGAERGDARLLAPRLVQLGLVRVGALTARAWALLLRGAAELHEGCIAGGVRDRGGRPDRWWWWWRGTTLVNKLADILALHLNLNYLLVVPAGTCW